MKQVIFACILILGFWLSAFAQSEKSSCPSIDVSGGGIVETKEPLSFSVTVQNADDYPNIEYVWTVSAGKIIEGQGTITIKVDQNDLKGENVTATVEIKGLPEGCRNTQSETGAVCSCAKPRLIDEFGRLFNGEVKIRIDEMYLKLSNEPNSQGYIINYGTDREIATREKQIQGAIAFRKYDTSRVTIVRGGANPNGKGVWTKVWIVPPGADNPQP